ncbi:glycoside hydrolase family 78 protein [Saccharata proteae CBS 121410]|uniref:Glycoside hydrolase family 78 protein n=1 Tax=Saccharata proteae CBS 121410 TaxID=1314787 RepID=A0A9P4M0P1_9PEZI|nr:glycoside hydrolase family 78 protein [Saccharata proteae CBS 121410]
MTGRSSFRTAVALAWLASAGQSIPYEQYILAPPSRELHPVSVYKINGTVSGAESVTGETTGSATFQDWSAVTFDYEKNIAGVVSLEIGSVSDDSQFIGLAYTESSLWISGNGSDATGNVGIDEILWFQPKEAGTYSVDRQHERGAFRYLSLIHNTTGSLEVKQITTYFTPMPHYADDELKNYTGYFHSDDELLNRIWYAGAYTNQLCTISPEHGNALVTVNFDDPSAPQIDTGEPMIWYNNYTITNGSSCLVDGAKRDRLVWAGDMSIGVPGIVASTNDLVSIKNSLDSLFSLQNPTTGQLPYAGRPLPSSLSLTYHMYTLIGVADYYLYSGNITFLQSYWPSWKLGINFTFGFIDESGMMNLTSAPSDWLRFGMGGHNIEANSILYYTLTQALTLAAAMNDTSVTSTYLSIQATLKSAVNAALWNSTAGLYRDNETTTLHPQDGNTWAVVSNITLNSTQSTAISNSLSSRWGAYGAPAPEAGSTVSPFIGGFELQAHIAAGNVSAAIELMRLQWGFMLDDPRMTNSSFIEGYSTDGSLHYAPYTDDARVSHAHGWATGPTGTLSFLVAGIQLQSAGGKEWLIKPAMGDLMHVEAGFMTPLGSFSVNVTKEEDGSFEMMFETPEGTMGEVSVEYPECSGTMILKEPDLTTRRVELPGSE